MCWSNCSGINSYDCGPLCANSDVNCARLTLTLISNGLDPVNSIKNFTANWKPKAPSFTTPGQLTTLIQNAANSSLALRFPSKYF